MEENELIEIELPTHEWLKANCNNRSVAIRYLSRECGASVKMISQYLGVPYRQVFGVVSKMNKAKHIDRVCPLCRRVG